MYLEENEGNIQVSDVDDQQSHPNIVENSEKQDSDVSLEAFPDTNINLQYMEGDRLVESMFY